MEDLLKNFVYPLEFEYIIELGIVNLKPWEVLFGERLNSANVGLKERYPGTNLIPFAVKSDCDDIACWDLDSEDKNVIILHDYSSVAWERREVFNTFWDWFRRASEDMIEFAEIDIEYERKNG